MAHSLEEAGLENPAAAQPVAAGLPGRILDRINRLIVIMSKQIFDKLPKDQQDAIMKLGAELEEFGTKEAMADDQEVAQVYGKKNAKVLDLDEKTVDKWRAIARDTAWKDYAQKTPLSAELIKLAEQVQVS